MRVRPGTVLGPIAMAFVATFGIHAVSVAADPNRVVVEIQGSKFVPDKASVRPGDIVVWRNQDIVPHTATARDASWDSALIPPGGEWQMVVSGESVVDYYCVFHPSMTAALDIVPQ